jgi:hypothetical protein
MRAMASRVKNGSGLSALEALGRRLPRDVQQPDGKTGVREVRRDLRAHGAGAEDCGRAHEADSDEVRGTSYELRVTSKSFE